MQEEDGKEMGEEMRKVFVKLLCRERQRKEGSHQKQNERRPL